MEKPPQFCVVGACWARDVLEKTCILWVCRTADLRLSRNVCREVSSYLTVRAVLAHLAGDYLRIFDVRQRRWSDALPLSATIAVGRGSAYTVLDDSTLFCYGVRDLDSCKWGSRYAVQSGAFKLHIRGESVAVETLPRMRQQRTGPGVIGFESVVYAFGGALDSSQLRSSEAYGRQSESWEVLRQMREGRSFFTPCRHHCLLYLSGGLGATCTEVYSPKASRFLSPLGPLLSERSASVSWAEDSTLLTLTRNYLTRIDLKKQRATASAHAECESYAITQPVATHDSAFFIDSESRLMQVSKGTQFSVKQVEATNTNHVLLISADSLRRFECVTERWEAAAKVLDPVPRDERGQYVLLDANSALYYGHGQVYSDPRRFYSERHFIGQVYRFSLTDTVVRVDRLPSMNTDRQSPGLAGHRQTIYAFGGMRHAGCEWQPVDRQRLSGRNCEVEGATAEDWKCIAHAGCLGSCECKPLHERWTNLQHMHKPRSCFTPCVHCGLIYLPGGQPANTVEVFDTEKVGFADALAVRLPERAPTLALVEADTLYILSPKWAVEISIKGDKAPLCTQHSIVNIPSCSPPIAVSGRWYFASGDGRVCRVDWREQLTCKWFALN